MTHRIRSLSQTAVLLTAGAAGLMAQTPAPRANAPAPPPQAGRGMPAIDPSPLGTVPSEAATPKIEFVFEELVTLAPNVNVGDTPFGGRNYIPITGGTIAGPKFKGKVVPGGWDFQLHLPNGCSTISADYFWQAEDGTHINIVNKAMTCPGGATGKLMTRPVFEAPKGPYEWMNSAVFVGTLEMGAGGVRIKIYQVK
jgi:hypothetical protein